MISIVGNKYRKQSLSKFDLQEISSEWEKAIDDEAFSVELGPFFQWAQEKVGPECVFFGLYDGPRCLGVAEVIKGRQKGKILTKLLKIVFSPTMWGSKIASSDVAFIYLEAIFECFRIGTDSAEYSESGFCVKIYGRTEDQFDMLFLVHKSITEKFSEHVSGNEHLAIETCMSGRWLVVSSRKDGD